MTTVTADIADFIVNAPGGAVPQEELDAVERSWFDAVGVLLGSQAEPHVRAIVEYVRQMGGRQQASVLGTSFRGPATEAALANGTMIHALDYDDTGDYGHPTAPILAALLALAEYRNGSSGRALAVAHSIGFEFGALLSNSGFDDERGFESTSVFGTLAGTAAGCRIMDLDPRKTQAALGIAASEACGLGASSGTMARPLQAGIAARNAVQAVLLARRGFTSAPDALEQVQGFCETFRGKGASLTGATARLGREFTLSRSVTPKKYACSDETVRLADAVIELVRRKDVRYEDIAEVEVRGISSTSSALRYPNPPNGLASRFSLHHVLGTAAEKGRLTADDFTDQAVKMPESARARAKIRAEAVGRWDPSSVNHQTQDYLVKIVLADGRSLIEHVSQRTLGGTSAPALSDQELVSKFRRNASVVLGAGQVEQAERQWRHLTEIDDIRASVSSVMTTADRAGSAAM